MTEEENKEAKNMVQIGDIVISSNDNLKKIHKRISKLLRDKDIKNYVNIQLPIKKRTVMFD